MPLKPVQHTSLTSDDKEQIVNKSAKDGHLAVMRARGLQRIDAVCLVSFLHSLHLERQLVVGDHRIVLDDNDQQKRADVLVGGRGVNGRILLFPDENENSSASAEATIEINGASGSIVLSRVRPEGGTTRDTIWLRPETAKLSIGGNETNGHIRIYAEQQEQFSGTPVVDIQADGSSHKAEFSIGGNETNGHIRMYSKQQIDGWPVVDVQADGGGDLFLRPLAGKKTAWLSSTGSLILGGNEVNGSILLFAAAKENSNDPKNAMVQIDGESGGITLRRFDDKSRVRTSIQLDAAEGSVQVGGNGKDGCLRLLAQDGDPTIRIEAERGFLGLGGYGAHSAISLNAANGNETLRIDGEAGDIVLGNADCAEDFDVVPEQIIEPGMVLVCDDEGALRPSTQAYDHRVAGVVAGAGDFRPGMILGRQPGVANRQPISLTGKTYCRVDAAYAPIRVGDLLTTSDTPGCAMKAEDPGRAFGAVIGKALRPLACGQGLIPILVALQ